MGTPFEAVSVPTIVRMTRHGQPNQVSDPRMQAFIQSGAYDLALDHPDYVGLAGELRARKREPLIRRFQRLTLTECGPELDLPFSRARILADVYGEEEGSFDLTKVELFRLDTSLTLGPALESALPRRNKVSMGARRRRWFVKNANARTLPEPQQSLADRWREEGFVLFFPDSSWENDRREECFEYCCGSGRQWVGDFVRSDNDVFGRYCILVGR